VRLLSPQRIFLLYVTRTGGGSVIIIQIFSFARARRINIYNGLPVGHPPPGDGGSSPIDEEDSRFSIRRCSHSSDASRHFQRGKSYHRETEAPHKSRGPTERREIFSFHAVSRKLIRIHEHESAARHPTAGEGFIKKERERERLFHAEYITPECIKVVSRCDVRV